MTATPASPPQTARSAREAPRYRHNFEIHESIMEDGAQWNVGEAKQRFSELLRAAESAPQVIRNRNRPVAVLMDAELYGEFQAWRQEREASSVGGAFGELRDILKEEDYRLETPPRKNRPGWTPED